MYLIYSPTLDEYYPAEMCSFQMQTSAIVPNSKTLAGNVWFYNPATSGSAIALGGAQGNAILGVINRLGAFTPVTQPS